MPAPVAHTSTTPRPASALLSHLPHAAAAKPAHLLQSSLRDNFRVPTYTVPHTTITTLSHLQRAIIQARRSSFRIKATTNPHSPSAHRAAKQGTRILSTRLLTAVTRTRTSLTAQAGARLTDLPVALVPPDASVGAAIANSLLAHGGFSEGYVAGALLAVSVVDSRGRLRVYTRGDYAGLFDTVVNSYGLSGVIYDATFAPGYAERVVRVSRTLSAMRVISVDGLRRVADGRTAAEITWVPFNSCDGSRWAPEQDQVVVKGVESTMLELSPGRGMRYTSVAEYVTRNVYELSAGGYSEFAARHTPAILRHAFDVCDGVYVTTLRDAMSGEYDAGGTVEESVMFPLGLDRMSDWARVVAAWEYVVGVVERDMKKGLYRLNVLMKMRFVAGVEEGECGCVLTVVSAVGTVGWYEFAGAIVREWVRMGGRWVVNRDGVRGVDLELGKVRRVVRNTGLDDCGMFEDDVVGFDEVRVTERFEHMSDVTVVDEDVPEWGVATARCELWWVWGYVMVYLVVWCWLFGREASVSVTNFLKSRN